MRLAAECGVWDRADSHLERRTVLHEGGDERLTRVTVVPLGAESRTFARREIIHTTCEVLPSNERIETM